MNSLDKYLEKIEELGYSYVVYKIDKEKEELTKIKEYEGKLNKTKSKNINCLMCKGVKKYEDDKYLETLRKLYDKQRNKQ